VAQGAGGAYEARRRGASHTHTSTLNFGELRKGEVRRILLPRRWVNNGPICQNSSRIHSCPSCYQHARSGQTDECKVEECERKVAEPNSLCIGCFGGLLTEEVIRTEDYRYIKNPNFKPKMGKRR
jgi:hypothetical protein